MRDLGLSPFGRNAGVVTGAASLAEGDTSVVAADNAFAAAKTHGSVVTWGDADNGGDSRAAAAEVRSSADTAKGHEGRSFGDLSLQEMARRSWYPPWAPCVTLQTFPENAPVSNDRHGAQYAPVNNDRDSLSHGTTSCAVLNPSIDGEVQAGVAVRPAAFSGRGPRSVSFGCWEWPRWALSSSVFGWHS